MICDAAQEGSGKPLPRPGKWNVLPNLEWLHFTRVGCLPGSYCLFPVQTIPVCSWKKKKSVYRRDYSLYTGTHYTFLDLCFVWCCPNPQLSGLGFLFHTSIVIWNFTICMGPWRSQPSKELVFAYNIQFSSPKKIKKGNLQFRHDLDWILSNVRQVVTLYEKLQCCALTSSSQPLILSGTSWNWYKEGRWGIGQKKTSALPWFLQRQQTQLVNTVQLIFPKLFLSNRLDSKEGLFG